MTIGSGFDAILRHVPPPVGDANKPLQMQVTTLDYSDFLGRIMIGRIHNGTISAGQPAALIRDDGTIKRGRISKLLGFQGLQRVEIVVAVGNDTQFVAFCQVLGLPELPSDERFATNPQRAKHRLLLVPLLAAA